MKSGNGEDGLRVLVSYISLINLALFINAKDLFQTGSF